MKKIKQTLEMAYEQMQEDRATIKESYEKFSGQVNSLQDYSFNGANLNKCLELLTKQTSQFLELIKLQNTIKGKDEEDFTSKDAEGVYNMINNEVTKLQPRRSGNR